MAKESSASRRARVKFQLRDKKGRWIEMGRGVKWYSPRLGREVSGTVVGSKGRNAIVNITSEPAGVTGKPQQVSVKGTDIEVIANKASIGAPAPKPSKQKVPTEKAKIADDGGRGVTPEMQKEIDRQLGRGDQKDEANPVVAVDEDEDLEDIDLDDDLDVEEEVEDSGADEDVDTSPTDIDALEATIEELEAVVEEVTSGDLDAAEIEAKLEEEVYSVYGNDGKQYDLDVKKDLEGKWNYRLRDAEGKARKIHALIPADENDSVDAGAKLDAAMNPKTKAKATTAKPKAEEKAPEADAVSETERNIDQFKPERVLPKNREDRYSSGADFETKHLTEEDIARLPVGTDIKGVDYDDRLFGEYFTKLADDSWITPHSDMANDAHMVESGEWTQGIFLPGNENNDNTPESLAADLDRYGRTWAPNQKDPNAPAGDKTPEANPSGSDTKKTVEAPKDTTPVPEGEQDALDFKVPRNKNAKSLAEAKKELDSLAEGTKVHFTDAMGENPESYQKVLNEKGRGVWAKLEDPDEPLEAEFYKESSNGNEDREVLTANELSRTHKGRNFDTEVPEDPAVAAERAKANKWLREDNPVNHPVPLQPAEKPEPARTETTSEDDTAVEYHGGNFFDMLRPKLVLASELEEGDSFIPVHSVDGEPISAQSSVKKVSPADADFTGGSPTAAPENVTIQKDTKPVTVSGHTEDGDLLFTRTTVSQRTQGARYGRGGEEIESEASINRAAYVLPDTAENRKLLADAGMEGINGAPLDKTSEEAKPEPKATTPERTDTPVSPGRLTRDELLKEVTDLEIKGAKAAGPEGDYNLSPEDSARRDALRKELDTREGEAPTEVTPEVESDEGAAALAAVGVERTEPRALPGEKFAPTRQQQDVIDAVMAGKDTVVQAKAGAGKTTTLQAIAARVAEASPDKKIVYVAFNSSVQKEAEARMPGNVEARTGHSIGFGWVGKDVNDRFKSGGVELDEDVAKHIGITGTYKGDPGSDDSTLYPEDIAAAAMLTVDKFAYNAEDDINEDHLPDSMFGTSPEAKAAVIDAANKIWADVNAPDGKIKLTQDHMRKMWALSRPDFGQTGAGLRRKADMLFIDEAQDTPPVLAKVIADQKMQKVIVGDADQAIYAFSGATDFLSKAEKDLELPLNRSWRFGAPVADAGNRFLQLLGSKGRVVGGGNSKISEGKMQDADAVLVRTNAGALAEMVEEGARGRIVGVEKKTIDKFNSAADTMDWLKSKNKGQTPIPKPKKVLPELAAYKDWNHVERENEKGDKPNLAMYVRLDGLYGSNGIRDALKNVVAVDSKSPGKASKGIGGNLNGVVMDDNGKTTVAGGSSSATFLNKDDLKEAGFRYRPDPSGELMRSGKNKGEPKKSWQALGTPEERAATVKRFADRIGSGYNPDEPDAEPTKPDVIISTAHKAKGLEWGKVRIGGDFPQPKLNKATGKMVMPDPENLRLAYVAVTRAEAELDPGSLGYVYEHTKENGGTPEPADKPAEQNEVTEPPISAADDSDFVPDSDNRVADTEAGAAPEAPQAPEADEVADESVPEAVPEAPEVAPEPVEAPEPTPAPTATPEPVETPEESAPTDTTPDPATPVDGLDEDGLTPDEAAYVAKLNKAIADGYRTGMGNVKALGERLDEMYERGAARLRGEDPDAVPEAAPEVKPAEDKEPATPEAKEEVVPEAEEVVEEAPEPTPEAPAEAEAEPVEVVETPTEDGPQGGASDGEEATEGGPTDLDSFEATASELFETFTNAQKTPRTPAELQDILDEEVYLLIGKDGVNYEFGLSIDDKGKWHYVLSDDDGNELERYNVITVPSEEAGQKAFERVNGSRDSEAPEEAPVDPADATPEAEEEIVEDADRVEPEEAPEIDPEVVPEPAPMPEVEVEEDTAPEAQTPEEAPQETPETAPEGGTAPAEPDTRPLHPVKQKAHNYPDGTQIKAARTDELIEKTKGKWHVAGSPSKAADPMSVEIPLVVEMPAQDDDSFTPFDGNIDSLVPGDIIRTQSGDQAAVIGIREGKVMAMAHGVPANRKALRPNTVSVDPSKIKGVNKFDAPVPEEEAPTAPAVSRTRTKSAGGTPIMDVDGNETKLGDRVMTAIGQGEVIALRPKSGPNGSVLVRMDDGKEKSFRSNKFTNAAFAELLEADDPATMVVGSQGTAEDGRKFLVGSGNKPIFKGDRVALSDGRIGTVAGIYAGAKSAGVTLEDGTTTRKRVSTLDAIDYAAPEKDTTVAEEPTPEAAPEVETTVEAPEVEAVIEEEAGESDPAVQPDVSDEWASTALSQEVKSVFDQHGLTPSQFRAVVAANSADSLIDGMTGRDTLSDAVSGEYTEDAWEAARTILGVRTQAMILSVMKAYNPAMDASAAGGVDFEGLAKSLGMLESKYSKAYNSTLKSLADVAPATMTPEEVASYNAEVDFSGFDPSTSKLNPLSDAGKAFGDVKGRRDTQPEGVKVRHKQTGAFGMVRETSTSEGAILMEAGKTGEISYTAASRVPWSDLDLVEVSAQGGTPDIAGATDTEGVAAAMSESFPDVHFDFTGMTTDGAKQYAGTIARLFNKFPQSRLSVMHVVSETAAPSQSPDAIAKGHAGVAMARTWTGNVRSTGHAVQRIEVNATSEKDISRADRSSERFHNHIDEGKGLEYTITHEFGHALDGQTGWTSRETIEGFLKQLYPNFKAGRDEYKLLYKEFSGYSFNRKTGRVDAKEIVAEAFADAELNATEAKPLSKLIHQYLMERLREV